MNLQTHIKHSLWVAISKAYETENYNHAILDAMHRLSDVLRERSGLSEDGNQLVGQALGGNSPVLRINRLQTQSEKDTQKGLEQILRGLYMGIRNPRSHEQIEDTKETADSIIYFINYLLGILDESREPFTISDFLERVFDEDFVKSRVYAELLVEEIPLSKRLDTLIEIYRKKDEGSAENIKYITNEVLKHLPDEQTTDFLRVVSEELKTTSDILDMRITLHILPSEMWPQISKTARLRIENKLINSIKEGSVNINDGLRGGAFGTWAQSFLDFFLLKNEVRRAIIEKLEGNDGDIRYILKYFVWTLPTIFQKDYQRNWCINTLCKAREESYGIAEWVDDRLRTVAWPDDWRNLFLERLPGVFPEEDDIPF